MMDAEHVALSTALREAIPIMLMARELREKFDNDIYCDTVDVYCHCIEDNCDA